MSEALIWHLIRDNNSFLVKRGRENRTGAVQFSKEPGNLLNVNSFKFSGLANEKVIDIAATSVDKKDRVVIRSKNPKALNKPKGSTSVTTLKKLEASYRGDLSAAVKRRFAKLERGVSIKKGLGKKARSATSRGTK